MLLLSIVVVTSVLLSILPVECSSGWYDIDEVRNTLYEPDISTVLSGLSPSFNLSTVTTDNKDSLLKKIYEDLPLRDDKNYVFVRSKTGQLFACKLPMVEPPKKAEEISYNPKYLAELVSASFYIKNCISKDLGWWKYKLCRGVDVKQWHGANRLMYLEEQYEGGTPCDLPDKKSARKTAVRYECDPLLSTSEAYIDQVEEAASCEYVITVKVGTLCSLNGFMPPNLNQANEIICQPFVSKEAIAKFLEDIIRKRTAREQAMKLADDALNMIRRIQRRRASMRRTELARDSSTEKSALRSYIDKEYNRAVERYVSIAVSDAYDYANIHDQDAGNLWYYFHDPTWNKTHFPKSLDYVDIMNAYYNAALKLLNEQVDYSLVQSLFPLLSKNPYNRHENLLLHGALSSTLRSAALQDIPTFFGGDSLLHQVAQNIATGRGIFGFKANNVINAFMIRVREEFRSGAELGMFGESVEEVLAIQYDLEQPFHKLSFFGIGLGKKADVLFEEYYLSVLKSRSLEERENRNTRLLRLMRTTFEQYSQQIFEEQWSAMAELLLYKKREQDAATYGKHTRDIFKNSFFDGKIVMNNADVKEVMSLLNTAGFKVEDVKVQVVSAGELGGRGEPKLSADEMKFLQELVKQQMEDIREMTRINQR
ncbi:hypothetical protein OESDEN_10271, partial [Oesophagostomum dentatum]